MITFKELGNYGRLGNQLWQIASTIGIAIENGHDYCFPTWSYQDYFKKKLPSFVNLNYIDYEEICSEYYDVELDYRNYNLKGYFQSYKHFDFCKNIVKSYFDPIIKIDKKLPPTVAIHVRRGDYLNLQHIHPVLSMDYYNKAMSLFPDRFFTVFTDDVYWCQKNFPEDKCTILIPSQDITDFFYMMSHGDFIIANSSYSWWAAYLSPFSGKIVAPNIWALNEPRETIDDRLPKEWERISI